MECGFAFQCLVHNFGDFIPSVGDCLNRFIEVVNCGRGKECLVLVQEVDITHEMSPLSMLS